MASPAAAASAVAEPLLVNGGFESGDGPERPAEWMATHWVEGPYRAARSEDRPHAGKLCMEECISPIQRLPFDLQVQRSSIIIEERQAQEHLAVGKALGGIKDRLGGDGVDVSPGIARGVERVDEAHDTRRASGRHEREVNAGCLPGQSPADQ